MKKIFSIVAAAVIALSFASCNNNGGAKGDGFKITISNIEATTATIAVEPNDKEGYYGVGIYASEVVAKYTVDSIAAFLADEIAYYVEMGYGLDVLAQHGMVLKGKLEQEATGLPSSTDLTVIAYELKEANNTVKLGNVASKSFKTKEIAIKETVELNASTAEFDLEYFDAYGVFSVNIVDEAKGLNLALFLDAEQLNGTFTEADFYSDGQYVYNYIEWGDGDDDWAALEKLQMAGTMNAEQTEYTVTGYAVGANEVKYTFNAKAVPAAEEEGGDEVAPAKMARNFRAANGLAPKKLTISHFAK